MNNCCSCVAGSIANLGWYFAIMVGGSAVCAAGAVQAAVSLPFRAFNLCQGNLFGGTNHQLKEKLQRDFGEVGAHTYQSLLLIINPYAEFKEMNSLGDLALSYFDSNLVDRCTCSEYFFNRQVTTRLCYALKIPAAAVARAFDAVVASIAMIPAILCLGMQQPLNGIAYSHANSAWRIVSELFECLLGILNPTAFPREIIKFVPIQME